MALMKALHGVHQRGQPVTPSAWSRDHLCDLTPSFIKRRKIDSGIAQEAAEGAHWQDTINEDSSGRQCQDGARRGCGLTGVWVGLFPVSIRTHHPDWPV